MIKILPKRKSLALVAIALSITCAGQVEAAQEKFLPSKEEHSHVNMDSMSTEQIDRAYALSALVMAPCCYAKTAAEDQSGAAHQVKDQIRLGVSKGFSDEEILAGFSEVYGERILSRPEAKGFNLMVWILPFVALLLAGLFAISFLKKTAQPAPVSAAKTGKKEGDDTAYARRVEDELRDLD